MAARLSDLLSSIGRARGHGQLNVACTGAQSAFYLGRDDEGRVGLLVRSSGRDRPAPLRLAGIDARFAVPCSIVDESGVERVETLSCILCLSTDPEVEAYFCSICESLIGMLGYSPTTSQIAGAVMQLVDIFQRLRTPARRSIVALLGELCVIAAARDMSAAVRAWRVDIEERFDFVVEDLRIDVKASGSRGRSHSISFEQANPPEGVTGVIASVWVEMAGGGTSLLQLVKSIERGLGGDAEATLILRKTIADSLGQSLPTAWETGFDLAVARSSLRFYDASLIPAIRAPLPVGVSGVRFTSELGPQHLAVTELSNRVSARARLILPHG